MAWYEDVFWFIRGFLAEFNRDVVKPALTEAIKEAIQMAISEEKHTKAIIGTSFMYGVLEFYAKHHLGFQPLNYNLNDESKHDYTRKYSPNGKRFVLSLATAFKILQQQNCSIAEALNDIDKFTTERLKIHGIDDCKQSGIYYKIVDKLTNTRNPMLHGERHSPKDGPYLSMLYILFHLMDLKQMETGPGDS